MVQTLKEYAQKINGLDNSETIAKITESLLKEGFKKENQISYLEKGYVEEITSKNIFILQVTDDLTYLLELFDQKTKLKVQISELSKLTSNECKSYALVSVGSKKNNETTFLIDLHAGQKPVAHVFMELRATISSFICDNSIP